MPLRNSRVSASVLACVLAFLESSGVHATPVILISIDGMRADAVQRLKEKGAMLPVLGDFIVNGTVAAGVVPANPAVTYPNHTTLVTGVWPAIHGIYSNGPFDPLGKNKGGWYWYADDVKAMTLWEAASKAGLATASVSWPVTVGAAGIRYNIPEFETESTDRLKAIEAVSRPDNLIRGIQRFAGPYAADGSEESDRIRARYAIEMVRRYKPSFTTVHLVSVDHVSHEHGPSSAETQHALETIDGLVGQLREAALAVDESAVTVVVSDHGFASVEWVVNLRRLFAEKGLIQLADLRAGAPAQVLSWRAAIWNAGGAAAVVLKDPSDSKLLTEVRSFLGELQADSRYGVERIYGPAEISELAAWPDATFVIEMKSGFTIGGDYSDDVLTADSTFGQHGYLANNPDMLAAFLVRGSSIARGRSLGVIDMRRIAPTVAKLLGVKLPAGTQPALDLAGP